MILYSRLDNKKTYVEFWGASTKHPDSMHCYQDDVEIGKYIPNEYQMEAGNIFQWLMYVASMKTWFAHAREVIEDILDLDNDYREAMRYITKKESV